MARRSNCPNFNGGFCSYSEKRGPLQATEICRQLNILGTQFESNFATLRHMELARGLKDGNKVFFRLF